MVDKFTLNKLLAAHVAVAIAAAVVAATAAAVAAAQRRWCASIISILLMNNTVRESM